MVIFKIVYKKKKVKGLQWRRTVSGWILIEKMLKRKYC